MRSSIKLHRWWNRCFPLDHFDHHMSHMAPCDTRGGDLWFLSCHMTVGWRVRLPVWLDVVNYFWLPLERERRFGLNAWFLFATWPERPTSGSQPQVKLAGSRRLPNPTPCVSSALFPPMSCRLVSFLRLPSAVSTCLFMLPQDALLTKTEHITAELLKSKKKTGSLAAAFGNK